MKVHGSSCKLTVILIRFELTLNFFDRLSKISQNQVSWNPFQWEPSCSIRTDRQDATNSRFSQFRERV